MQLVLTRGDTTLIFYADTSFNNLRSLNSSILFTISLRDLEPFSTFPSNLSESLSPSEAVSNNFQSSLSERFNVLPGLLINEILKSVLLDLKIFE